MLKAIVEVKLSGFCEAVRYSSLGVVFFAPTNAVSVSAL